MAKANGLNVKIWIIFCFILNTFHQISNASDSIELDSILIQEEGFYGYLYKPKAQNNLKPIIILGGSDGGIKMKKETRDFALSGFAALNVAYFDYENLPKYLAEIPVEYFEKSIKWILNQDYIESTTVAVFGFSRGAELALILASEYPDISVVVTMATSNLRWGGWGGWGKNHNYNIDKLPAWTKSGEPLPWMNIALDTLECSKYKNIAGCIEKKILPIKMAKDATIPVHKSSAAFLLISGSEDAVWPSAKMAENTIKILDKNTYKLPHKHLIFDNKGHYIDLKKVKVNNRICWDYLIDFIKVNIK